jgi:hypothetical protein
MVGGYPSSNAQNAAKGNPLRASVYVNTTDLSAGLTYGRTILFADDAITITQVNAIMHDSGGGPPPEMSINISFATERSDGTPNNLWTVEKSLDDTITGQEWPAMGSFNDATVPAGSWVWLRAPLVTAAPDAGLEVALEYTLD